MIEMLLTELAVKIRCAVHCHALEDLFTLYVILAYLPLFRLNSVYMQHACRTPLVVLMCSTHRWTDDTDMLS
jgi:hypothetical protein